MKLRRWIIGIGIAVALVAIVLLGQTLQAPTGGAASSRSAMQATSSGSSAVAPEVAAPYGANASKDAAGGQTAVGAVSGNAPSPGSTPVPERMIVQTASVALDVKDVRATVTRIRALALTDTALIENLSFATGGDVTPLPADGQFSTSSDALGGNGQPTTAQITLRVPAEKLAHLRGAISGLGQVQSEGSSADDVTQQHVDMQARLRNLQAEEGRLRQLYARAGRVSDLLEVERRLSDVRGQIESLQAQIGYLERQVALATLTVSLSEPGAIVRPSAGTDWGIRNAVTVGVQSAVALVGALVAGTIAASPIIAFGLIVWLLVVVIRRARRRGSPSAPEEPAPSTAC